MKKVYLAKRGITPIILTCGLRLPISLILSSIMANILHSFFQLNKLSLLWCFLLIFNLLFILKTSFVKIKDGTIKYKHYAICKTMCLKFEDVISYTVLSPKEYQCLCNNLTRNNNLSANCMSVFLPLNRNVILFKDNDYREIAISVYNFDEFYNYIKSNLNLETKNENSYDKSFNTKKENLREKKTERYFLKMPVKDYVACFFKSFIVTIICPLIISAVLSFALVKVFEGFNYYICLIVVFVLHSIYFYIFEILKVTNDKISKSIKITCPYNKNTLIKYENIKDCHYINSSNEIEELCNNKNLFKTPFSSSNWKNVIYIELNNHRIYLLSVSNSEKLYNFLMNFV